MERYVMLVMLAIIGIGCSTPQFGNVKQWREGDWYFGASPGQVARMEQDKTALDKLKEQPVQVKVKNGVMMGYRGVVQNFSRYERITIEAIGPEKRVWVLSPGEFQDQEFLVPGDYVARAYRRGYPVGTTQAFNVGVQEKNYINGKKYHWMAFYED